MAIFKLREINKMSAKDRDEKMKELRIELIRANVAANKTNSKTKEIKRAISRLLTFNKSKEELKKK